MKGSSRDVIEVLSRHLPGGTVEKPTKNFGQCNPYRGLRKAPQEWIGEKEMWPYSTLVTL